MFPQRFYPNWNSLDQLRHEMNHLLENVTGGLVPGSFLGGRAFPALNLWEDGECLYVEAEVPGMSMDDLDVHITGNDLTIKGERKGMAGENLTYHRQERGTGAFSRSINLPLEVNPDKVEAVLKDGVLTITLPKSAAARSRKITVLTK